MARTTVHLSEMRRSVSGTTIATTLCRRFRITDDGMNLTDKPAEVTCKLCLAAMRLRRAA